MSPAEDAEREPALRIAGAHLASHPTQTVRGYLTQVSEGDGLSQLSVEHDQQAAVRASFAAGLP